MNIDKDKLSPMMKRYFQIKDNYPDCLLFFRLGDFYEMFSTMPSLLRECSI